MAWRSKRKGRGGSGQIDFHSSLPPPGGQERPKKKIKINRNVSCCQLAVVTPSPRGHCCFVTLPGCAAQVLEGKAEWSQGRRRGFATKMLLPKRNEAQCTHIQNEYPPFCIIRSVKMYIFYRFIDIYRFSILSPAQWRGCFFTYLQIHSLFLNFVQPGEAVWGQDTAGCDPPGPPNPCPMGREGAGQGSSSMAESPRCATALPPPGFAGSTWAQVQAGISSIQCFCSSSRAASLGRAAAEGAISRKKKKNTTTTLKHLLQAQLPRPQSWQELLELPGWSLQDQSPLELPSTILSKEAE